MTVRRMSRCTGVADTSGRRRRSEGMRPVICSAALMRMGFEVTNSAATRSASERRSAAPRPCRRAVRRDQIGHLLAHEVGRDRDDPGAAQLDDGQQHVVVAGVDGQRGARGDLAQLAQSSCACFTATTFRDVGQLGEEVGLQVEDRPPGML